MKTLFTVEAISQSGRSGTIAASGGLLDVPLGNPLLPRFEERGPIPERLLAGMFCAGGPSAWRAAAKTLAPGGGGRGAGPEELAGNCPAVMTA